MIDRAGHYETLSRLIDGAQQIEIGAEDSPYALNPWDVPDPAKVSREKIAFLLALHQVMMGRLDGAAARDARLRRSAPSTPRRPRCPAARRRESMLQRGAARPGRGRAEGRRGRDRRDAAQPRRPAVASTAARAPTPTCSTAPTTVPLDSPLVVFDTRRCPESQLQLVMFAIMEYVTGTVERHWAGAPRGRGEAGRAAVPRPLDDADRRGVASDQPRRDRRVRQQPRPPRPPPRAGADRDDPAAV